MPLRIFNNLSSQYAQNPLSSHNDNLGKAIVTVASGEGFKNSSDDEASLAISESLHSDAAHFVKGQDPCRTALPLSIILRGRIWISHIPDGARMLW
jgi:hypothetical protein